MAGMTGPVKVVPYGTEGPIGSWPVGATQQLYPGEVALVSGGGSVTKGNLKNAATAGSTDLVVGMLQDYAGGTGVDIGTGFVGGSNDGNVWMDTMGGAFMFQSGTGSDQLSAATNGLTVYYGGENSSGPIACATGSGTRPVLGIQKPQDPGFAGTGGADPGSAYWPIVLNVIAAGA